MISNPPTPDAASGSTPSYKSIKPEFKSKDECFETAKVALQLKVDVY